MIANAQQAQQLVRNSKHYRLDYLLSRIEALAKSGGRSHEEKSLSPEEVNALVLRGFKVTPTTSFLIAWEETT